MSTTTVKTILEGDFKLFFDECVEACKLWYFENKPTDVAYIPLHDSWNLPVYIGLKDNIMQLIEVFVQNEDLSIVYDKCKILSELYNYKIIK